MSVFLLFALLLGTAGAAPNSISRIVGGSDTTIEQYPFMSNMLNRNLDTDVWVQTCGGSVLTSRTILSAAQCYFASRPAHWRVRLGSSFRSSGGTVHSVSELILHPDFRESTLDNDVAIIRLEEDVIFSIAVQPARIGGPLYIIPDGTALTSIGWGDLTYWGARPDQLQHVDVELINQDICVQRYAFLKGQPGYSLWPEVTPRMLCAGILDYGDKNACHGDFGGPLVHDSDVIIGITSWGWGCADRYYPGVNARVPYYADWIVANGASV